MDVASIVKEPSIDKDPLLINKIPSSSSVYAVPPDLGVIPEKIVSQQSLRGTTLYLLSELNIVLNLG